MSKYIIELDYDLQRVVGVGVKQGTVWVKDYDIDNLEELCADYINEHFGQLQDEAYQRGLDDAWEAARKLFSSMADSDIEKAFPVEWNNGGFNVLINLQPQEAIAKLKAYEEKQKADDEIKVGDEVEWTGDKYIVTYINYDIDTSEITDYDLLGDDGSVADHVKKCAFTKTGRHFDIASILEDMRHD